MKAVILAGGTGTRLSEETVLKPKPMVEIGSMPIIWHIMKTYSAYGINDFVICCGYKGYMIKEFFSNYFRHRSNLTIDLANNSIEVLDSVVEPWRVTLIDTGLNTMTGGRIKRIRPYIGNEAFMLTYGDGVSDINISDLSAFHEKGSKLCTITGVKPMGRFGALEIGDNHQVKSFMEKPQGDGAWINGGYMVCQPEVFDYIPEGDDVIFERTPMESLASANQMQMYEHTGFWKPMDTLRDKEELNQLWENGSAPWKIWK